ncbi:MAG: S8 family peptidase [Deltaproteobacteria bacterium]|nr:S8 family peptidase [Deltaproteobacteria bacterium]
MRAVRFEGVEWLGELLADLDQDEDFSLTGDEEEDADDLQEAQPIRGRLYMLMADRRGWAELQSLWVRYQANPDQRFEHGLNKWKSLFKFLRGIRPWGAEDRKAGTGVEDYWRAELDANAARVRFEVELWYREDQRRRDAGLASLRDLVAGAGGSVITSAAIPEIAYHAALVELPGGSLRPLLEGNDPRLLQLDQIMFFQPLGQARSGPAIGSAGPLGDAAEREVPRGREPIAAILDGLPLENHELLRDRLIVDDPDGWARNYQAIRRVHGTAMASLVVHGDLAAGERPLESPVYLRPIMRPDPHLPEEEECTPPDQLLVDLMHRAVRRLFEPSEGQDPVAPSVRVINLSVGDRLRRFDQVPSAWARLLDWLSHKHDVLFVIAAGNHTDAIELPVPPDAVRDLRGPRLEDAILRTLRDSRWARRLVIPAEAMNAITVGGLHHDASGNAVPGRLIEPFATPSMPSIFNPIASGIRRAIKPEVLFNAGRQLLTEPTPAGGSSRMWLAQPEERGPGQVIARPSPTPGEVRARCHSWGTSNAAALATRAAAFIYDIIEDLRTTHGGDQLDRAVEAQLIKALLVHGAAWDTRTRARIEELIEDRSAFKKRSLVTSFLGYGSATIERVLDCTQHRVTLVGVGSLANDRGHRFSLPIPEAFARRAMRRAVITLAWISPVLPRDQRYRQAKLWFDPEPLKSMLRMERSDGDWRAVRRGTVQHEVLEGEAAIVIPEAATAELVVSCRAEGGRLPRPVRYALVVTLEIAEAIEVDIYEEVRAAIQVAVRTRPVGRTTQ